MTSNKLKCLVRMSELGIDEDEEPWQAEIPRVGVNPKNPTNRENTNMKIRDMLFTEVCVRLVSKAEELVDNIELNCWMKKNHSYCCFRLSFHDARKR